MPNTRKNPLDPDSPFLTRDAVRNAKTFAERFPLMDPSNVKVVIVSENDHGLTPYAQPTTNVPLPSDIVTDLRATGPEWVSLAESILRAGLKKRQQKAA